MNKSLLVASEGARLAFTSTKNRLKSPKKYSGTTEQICRSIIEDCFDKKKNYFRVSPHNFRQFYARDFGMCCKSLLNLGYKNEVKQSLVYAMSIYKTAGEMTTHITPSGKAVDFPSHTPESAAYMLHSLILLNDKKLLMEYKDFFSKIANKVYENDIDKKTGLLRKDKRFSSMKDHALRESDCYNNCFLAMFANDLKRININSPLKKYDFKKIIEKNFLKEDYFLEDLSGKEVFATDANVFPFWTGVFNDRKLLIKIIKRIKEKKLDDPWPLRYTTKEDAPKNLHVADLLVPGYEKDTLWIHLGLCYMKTISDVDKKLLKTYLKKYKELIQKYGTFYEVYETNGKVFSRLLYKSDEAMLWCSIFLELYLKNQKNI